MWDLNFETWISHRGLHMIQDLEFFGHMIFRTWMGNQATVFEGHGHPLVNLISTIDIV